MAYYSLHSYDADVRIPFFNGLRQDSVTATDLRYADEAENVETPNGVLQPQAGVTVTKNADGDNPFLGVKVETIARFHRRWYTGQGTNEWLVCAAGGFIYCRQANDRIGWVKVHMPQEMDHFESNVWSWVTYEIPNPADNTITLDVILISNAKDGMYMVIPPDKPTTWGEIAAYTWAELSEMTWEEVYSEKWTIVPVPTREFKFGVIERHKERIWGSDIDGMPDTLVYSAIYDPTDWDLYDPNYDPTDPDAPDYTKQGQPEDGSGQIDQPSWDGDKFTTLRTFGDQLIAFKGNRVWRVMGISPGEYAFTEQYGGGTLYPNSVAIDVDRIYMVENDGLSLYDGMTVSPFRRPFIEKFWRTVNKSALNQCCATMHKHKYYVALPTGDSEVNNTLLVYNTEDGSFLTYTDIYIESLLSAGDVLYATSSTVPGEIWEINYDSWQTGVSSGKGSKWATAWMDFNYKSIVKGGYEIYFSPEVMGAPITFRFTIETEKKSKSKVVTVQPTAFAQKQKRVRFGGTSRRFRLIIEALPSPRKAVWRLTGGIQMIVETDPD